MVKKSNVKEYIIFTQVICFEMGTISALGKLSQVLRCLCDKNSYFKLILYLNQNGESSNNSIGNIIHS